VPRRTHQLCMLLCQLSEACRLATADAEGCHAEGAILEADAALVEALQAAPKLCHPTSANCHLCQSSGTGGSLGNGGIEGQACRHRYRR